MCKMSIFLLGVEDYLLTYFRKLHLLSFTISFLYLLTFNSIFSHIYSLSHSSVLLLHITIDLLYLPIWLHLNSYQFCHFQSQTYLLPTLIISQTKPFFFLSFCFFFLWSSLSFCFPFQKLPSILFLIFCDWPYQNCLSTSGRQTLGQTIACKKPRSEASLIKALRS